MATLPIINSTQFGDLSTKRAWSNGNNQLCNSTRGCIAGGSNSRSPSMAVDEVTTIQYVDLNSGGNAIAFGDMSIPRRNHRGVSDSHGGLGGY